MVEFSEFRFGMHCEDVVFGIEYFRALVAVDNLSERFDEVNVGNLDKWCYYTLLMWQADSPMQLQYPDWRDRSEVVLKMCEMPYLESSKDWRTGVNDMRNHCDDLMIELMGIYMRWHGNDELNEIITLTLMIWEANKIMITPASQTGSNDKGIDITKNVAQKLDLVSKVDIAVKQKKEKMKALWGIHKENKDTVAPGGMFADKVLTPILQDKLIERTRDEEGISLYDSQFMTRDEVKARYHQKGRDKRQAEIESTKALNGDIAVTRSNRVKIDKSGRLIGA